MKKIVECIPNFSEGRNKKKVAEIIAAIKSVNGVFLLDQESDLSHNRSVITFAGEPSAVLKAAFRGVKKAAELIDMEKHRGQHPRMGATDVLPLVPLKGVSEKECIKYAHKLGEHIGRELNIPVYLYEKAAKKPWCKNLADVRQGEYEGIKKEIGKNLQRKPDFGPSKLGKAGATAIGVRAPLIAYNINLASKNLSVAKAIAKKIRFKDGGFPCVKALGFELADRGIIQVSMNLTDYKVTGIDTVFKAIQKECKKYNIKILESEIVGLIPEEALINIAINHLKLRNFSEKQILEKILAEKILATNQRSKTQQLAANHQSLKNFLDELASKKPVPGGGSVSALAGALAAALCSMVANLTLANKKYSKVHKNIAKVLKETEKLRQQLYELIEEDTKAYQKVVEAYKTSNANKNSSHLVQQALKKAALTPLKIAQTAAQLLKPLKTLAKEGNKNAISDCGVAKHLIEAAVKGAILNIKINLKYIEDKKFVADTRKKLNFGSVQN